MNRILHHAALTDGRRGSLRKRVALISVMVLMAAVLSGCLYPKDSLAQNRAPAKEAVRTIQAAVDQYRTDQSGMLPIENSSTETPKYEKFIIDFGKLQRMNYLSDIPSAAFEKGGNYYFLLLDEETDPNVKLMDLHLYQQMNDIQKWSDEYKRASGGELPAGEEVYPSFYYIDFEKLGHKSPDLRSVYSGQPLNVMIHDNGTVFADYGIDLRKAVEKTGGNPDSAKDLRELLVSSSDFVPVKSPMYRWVNGDPQAQLPE
jgi:hypothetical protein